jgi:GTP-binding protein
MAFTVAIIGRPNVGKSTLFNRLVGRRSALVDDTPGVTRDRREGQGRIGKLAFTVIDTAGLEDAFDDSLEARMRRQTDQAVAQADVVLFMIDARAGVTPLDRHFAGWLRRAKKPILVLANKCEGSAAHAGRSEAYALGLGDPIALAAEHGLGMDELQQALRKHAPAAEAEAADAKGRGAPPPHKTRRGGDADEGEADDGDADESETATPSGPLRLAIVGRPNVGKSTLVNRLIGEDRLLTGPEAGITRDSIEIDWLHRGRSIRLVDTAGLRRRAHVVNKLEKLSVGDTLNTIRFAHVVVVVIDADMILEKQDLMIARMVAEEGRALVLAINKWDRVADRQAALERLRDKLEVALPQVKGVAAVPISALTGRSLDKLMDQVFAAHEIWNRRVPTPQLNRWLAEVTQRHPPPLVDGRTVKLRYATQNKTRPPTIQLFASKPKELPDSYQRYLVNSLRDVFGMPGTPVRIVMRKGKNPYAER